MTSRFHMRPAAAALALALAVSACGETQPAPPAPAAEPAVAADPIDPATAGSITGRVTFEGVPAAPRIVKGAASDPNCPPTVLTQTTVLGDTGALQHVFVYVKEGLGNRRFAPPATPVLLDQKGCQYTPHVLGIQVGQPLQIVSSDPTLHNVHAIPEKNREFNTGQPVPGVPHTHTFSTAEVMVPFKCDVHRWMTAFVGVVDHPFYAVTGADGRFELKGLPPGTYTIEAWQEEHGTQSQTVTIGEKETKDVGFSFTRKTT